MFKLDFSPVNWVKYIKGHVQPFWNKHDYIHVPYEKEKITRIEELNQWKEFGYPDNTNFEGFMYDSKNPMPLFVQRFEKIFSNVTNMTYTLYRMDNVTVMPEHVDHFTTYKKLFNVEDEQVIRILVMLEDWQPGHYLDVAGEGIVNWKAGDFFAWKNDVPHSASNIGKNIHPRYTLQITATLKEETEFTQANKVYTFNLPRGDWIVDSVSIDRIRHVTNNNNGLPYIIYMGNGNITGLDDIHLSDADLADLKISGLDIYLYEPLCSYVKWQTEYVPGGTKHSDWFYSEIPSHINNEFIRADELDSIVAFIEKHDLTDVRVHTCDYDVDKHYPYYKNKMYLLYDDVFVKTRYFRRVLDHTFHDADEGFAVKFLSLNYRYTFHRHLTCAYLANYNANISWPYKCDYEHVKKGPYYDLDNNIWDNKRERLIDGAAKLNDLAPLTLDFNFSEPTVIEHHYFKPRFPNNQIISDINVFNIEKFYKESFCEIVCESRFAQPTANYSEKTLEPMFYHRPFLLLAPPHTLKALKEHGFKTFGDFWDESYDEIEDHEKRLHKVFTLIADIDTMSLITCKELHHSMLPVLEHNHRLLRTKLML